MGFARRKGPRLDPENKHLQKISLALPRSLYNAVMAKAEELKMPVSNVIAYAIDNELAESDAFEYPCELPTTVYVDSAYREEAVSIFNFVQKNGGLPLDMLMLSRRDMGILNKETFMLAIRELNEIGSFTEWVQPTWTKSWHKFPDHVRFLVLKTTPDERKQKKIDELKKELNKLEGKKDAFKES